jgi:hypothetical protein
LEDLKDRVQRAPALAGYLMGVEWPQLYRQVDMLRQAGAEPGDPRVQPLVRRMQQLSVAFGGGGESSARVRRVWREHGGWPELSDFVQAARAALPSEDAVGSRPEKA